MSTSPKRPPPIVVLMGCTATGKTDVAMQLAPRLGAEIVCVDSMQVYRGMDIGTAKPTPAQRERVPHHLIDVAEPHEAFNVARFVDAADRAIADVHERGRRVLAVAGTPLYLMGLLYGMFEGPSADGAYRMLLRERAAQAGTGELHTELKKVDPAAAERIHPNDLKRIERALEVWRLTGRRLSEQQRQWSAATTRYPAVLVGLRRSVEETSRRINRRVKQMMGDGLLEEVRRINDAGGFGEQARRAVGYSQLLDYFEGRWSLETAVEKIKIQSRRLAKHQRTWFKRFPGTHWVDVAEADGVEAVVVRLLRAAFPVGTGQNG